MSSTGAGYDYSCSQYSPDGRIFQVEYAIKAVESSGTAIGLKCRDGIVLGVEKPQISKMLMNNSNRRIFGINNTTGGLITGYPADGRQLINRAREEAQSYEDTYGHSIIPSILANRLALYTHYFTLHYSLRPFGTALLFVGYDEDMKQSELYMVEPNGMVRRYFGCAAGKGSQAANTELEKIYVKHGGIEGLTCKEAVKYIAQIMYTVRDSSNDKPFELEMAWALNENNHKFQHVPKELIDEADEYGKNNIIPDNNNNNNISEGVEETKMEE
eukprot:TRINITY_DN51151_c0_g1_i1.p1 TRINITY_DN51151_c0_g1~~TRINITY_DN51151_c0_g1_i1.p1  ORF type:complete len:272 (+),score=4.73 TRINITY_DN51151_c0_g1_i1:30-845(+)